jgi:putative inorganic carbon (HCO3(-)) transporter
MSASSVPAGIPIAARARVMWQMPFGLLLCLALLSNLFKTGGHDRQRLAGIAVLVVAALAALATKQVPQLFQARAGKPLAMFFLLGILGSIGAFSPAYALFEVSIFFLLYLFAQLIAGEIARGGNMTMLALVQVMALTCALYSLQFWVAYSAGFVLHISLDVGDFALPFGNIRFFNHMQTATLPLIILLCCITPGQSRLRLLWWGLSAYWWMAIFATSGRGTLMGMIGGCIAVAILRRRQARSYLKAAALSAACGLLAYFVFLVAIPYLLGVESLGALRYGIDRTAADPASGRGILWHRAISLILQHPLLGVGPMHFAHNAGDLHIGAHPHDWIMQIASEWGIPAFLCLCAALACGGRALLRAGSRLAAEDQLNQTICSALVAGSATILIDGLVSGLFVMPQSQLAIALFLGCAIGWYRANAGPAPDIAQPTRIRRAGAAVLIVAAAACLVTVVWPDVAARYNGDGLRPAQAALNAGTNWPRLWYGGFF